MRGPAVLLRPEELYRPSRLCCLLALVVMLPFFWGFAFVFPQGEDFEHMSRAMCFLDLPGGLYEMGRQWLCAGGRYGLHFLQTFLGRAPESLLLNGAICLLSLGSYGLAVYGLARLAAPAIPHRLGLFCGLLAMLGLCACHPQAHQFFSLTQNLSLVLPGGLWLCFLLTICRLWLADAFARKRRCRQAMLLAAREAKRLGHPVVLDPVAAGASRLRGEMCSHLLADGLVSVVRGNVSELRALAAGKGQEGGVEASALDRVTEENLAESAAWLQDFSRRTGVVALMTGALDLITDGKRTAVLRGGSALLRRITGAGCMLTSLTAACCGANPDTLLEAAAAAAGVMKVCGEQAERRVREEMEGTASFRTRLIDAVSRLTDDELAEGLRIELL